MINKATYESFLDNLLLGNKQNCKDIIHGLIDLNIDVKLIYVDLFQASLYRIGQLWEQQKISVAIEHMATAIVDSLFSIVYPKIFSTYHTDKTVIISCIANEFHQIGGRMVADIFELNGWNSYFLGANTPINQLRDYIEKKQPDLIGLSLSIYFNMPILIETIEDLRKNYPNLKIILGGQAFSLDQDKNKFVDNGIEYFKDIFEIEKTFFFSHN